MVCMCTRPSSQDNSEVMQISIVPIYQVCLHNTAVDNVCVGGGGPVGPLNFIKR